MTRFRFTTQSDEEPPGNPVLLGCHAAQIWLSAAGKIIPLLFYLNACLFVRSSTLFRVTYCAYRAAKGAGDRGALRMCFQRSTTLHRVTNRFVETRRERVVRGALWVYIHLDYASHVGSGSSRLQQPDGRSSAPCRKRHLLREVPCPYNVALPLNPQGP